MRNLLPAYDEIYRTLLELSGRYTEFTEFRVIGHSHDGREIPMMELGTGDVCFYCICGLQSRDYEITSQLTQLLQLYCRAFEKNWELDHSYRVRGLLSQTRLLIVPLLNPDGYEICRQGYFALRNPVFRQMLRSEYSNCLTDYDGNARGNRLNRLFLMDTADTAADAKRQMLPENENRALMGLFRENRGDGLLRLTTEKSTTHTEITYCRKRFAPVFHHRSRRIVYGLKHPMGEETTPFSRPSGQAFAKGTLESCYTTFTDEPSIRVQLSASHEITFGELLKYPMECLTSFVES